MRSEGIVIGTPGGGGKEQGRAGQVAAGPSKGENVVRRYGGIAGHAERCPDAGAGHRRVFEYRWLYWAFERGWVGGKGWVGGARLVCEKHDGDFVGGQPALGQRLVRRVGKRPFRYP